MPSPSSPSSLSSSPVNIPVPEPGAQSPRPNPPSRRPEPQPSTSENTLFFFFQADRHRQRPTSRSQAERLTLRNHAALARPSQRSEGATEQQAYDHDLTLNLNNHLLNRPLTNCARERQYIFSSSCAEVLPSSAPDRTTRTLTSLDDTLGQAAPRVTSSHACY